MICTFSVILSVFVVSLSIANEDIAQESTLKDSINQFSTGFYKVILYYFCICDIFNMIISYLMFMICVGNCCIKS